MLVLSRKVGQTLVIGNDLTVTVNRIAGNRVTIGIEAPKALRVVRGELEQPHGGQSDGAHKTSDAVAGEVVEVAPSRQAKAAALIAQVQAAARRRGEASQAAGPAAVAAEGEATGGPGRCEEAA